MMIVVVGGGSVLLIVKKIVNREVATTANATIYRELLTVVPTYL